ncbi:ABC transporter substrate-binding protein [Nostoc sp. CENA67]|uniref:ABC transporter substrate-binding protein n=1 Tax=Amazonocrinis nigriterrae CENA67 TaxID=2794033 RepID=A0A8J7HT13_9NOST|nr:ABC transporter substrate-binding protein [Amazonocrinis nigriterrae]MBH8562982.1 ABC transporter substrate-binding protein [Amazonocrinis nigriterrae CENA67]
MRGIRLSHLYDSRKRIYGINRRKFLQYSSLALGTGILAACTNENKISTVTPASDFRSNGKLDKVIFSIHWVAEAEYGGFYQAVATGIYRDHGLDVTIKPGGPRGNYTLLLMGGSVDLIMGHSGDAISALKDGVPMITVAATFQKDPQVLIAHPGTGNDSLEKLKGKPILVGSGGEATYWPFLKAKYGFTDDQKRPYNFDVQPFLKDKNIIQQGLLTAEPFEIKKKGGFEPVSILLADYGYNAYGFTIETTKKLVERNPDLVQRFVDASIKGWYSYLEDPVPGNNLIKKDNPDMTDEQLNFSLEKLKQNAVITGGEAQQLGIGAMTEERWRSFYDNLVKAGVVEGNINYKDAFTLQFVNKGVNYYKS